MSDKGKIDINKVGEELKNAGYSADEIFHSGKTRARESAEILAKYVLKGNKISAQNGMDPNDDVKPWIDKINSYKGDLMMVGHLPFMAKLLALLINGDENNFAVEFDQGTTAVLNKDSSGKWINERVVKP